MSTSALDLIVRKVGQDAGIEPRPQAHPTDCPGPQRQRLSLSGRNWGGHKRLETTRRYTLPTVGDKQRALEGITE